MPAGSYLTTVINGFNRRGFPQVVGAIDGTHISIQAPQSSTADYYNRKGFHSVILQGVVDHMGNLIDVYAGWPGRVHDSRVLHDSELCAKAECGKLFDPCPVVLGRNRVSTRCYFGRPCIPSQILADETLH